MLVRQIQRLFQTTARTVRLVPGIVMRQPGRRQKGSSTGGKPALSSTAAAAAVSARVVRQEW